MDIELIENLSDEQVNDLYADVVDGEADLLGGWNCHIYFFSPGVVFDSQYREFPGYRMSAVWSGIVAVRTNADGTTGYVGGYLEGGPWSYGLNYSTTRAETYFFKVNLLTDKETESNNVSYILDGRHSSDTWWTELYNNCDNIDFCESYFNYLLLRAKHCNIEQARPYSNSELIERNGKEIYQEIYTSCSNIADLNWGWHSDLGLAIYRKDHFNVHFGHTSEAYAYWPHGGSILYLLYIEKHTESSDFEVVYSLYRVTNFHSTIFQIDNGVNCHSYR